MNCEEELKTKPTCTTNGIIKIKDTTSKENLYCINKNEAGIRGYISQEKFKGILDLIKLEKRIRNLKYIICQEVIDKFKNKNIKKIYEVVDIFLQNGKIKILNDEIAELSMKIYDIKFLINYKKQTINEVIHEKNKEIKNNSIYFVKGKATILEDENVKEDELIFKKQVFLEQIELLEGNNIDKKMVIEDIKNNLKEIKLIEGEEDKINIVTANYEYEIINYNIRKVKTLSNNINIFKEESVIENDIKEEVNIVNISEKEFLTNMKVINLYGSIKSAKNYVNKLGVSIKVICKFITEDNISELYNFMADDIIYYGTVLYDNYIDNCMIIKTKRFYYLIKNNVIINIKTINKEDIKECSIPFRKIKDKFVTEKKCILDLEIGDRVRNIISQNTINSLVMKEHAKERYLERISKNVDLTKVEAEIKKDIYKNGVVCMGTYYKNTKLIKGYKYIYIINNNYIISVWKINSKIENIENRYKNMIEELTMSELEEII